ncbi:MAG: M56 family metallopeptidase [Victivallaceae bacterium]|nr:M56 family metallopeptidase [Victivallaceae bacterium]
MDIFIQWLIANSLKGTVLIIAVFLVQFVFSKQIPQKWKYLMWLLVAIRLVMPSLLESKSSIFNLKNTWQKKTVNPVQLTIAPPTQAAAIENSFPQTVTAYAAVPETGIKLSTVIFSVWATVSLLLFLYLLRKNSRISALVSKEKTVIASKWLKLLENCKRELKLHIPIQVVETAYVSTPALMGFVRPRILLPEGMQNAMTEPEMKLIFMHELTHLKRGDTIINWIISLIQIIHWFNPFVWLAFAKAREARELACDNDVLSFLEKNKSKKYGLTIIKLLELYCHENRITGMVGILENKKQMKRRIEMIRNHRQGTKRAAVFTLILLLLMGAVFLSEAIDDYAEEKFTSETLGISINPPVAASTDIKCPAYLIATFLLPAQSGFAANVNIIKQSYNLPMAAYDKLSLSQFKSLNAKVLTHELKGNEARYEYMLGDKKLHFYVRAVKQGKSIYCITATALNSSWETQKAALIKSVNSFKVVK